MHYQLLHITDINIKLEEYEIYKPQRLKALALECSEGATKGLRDSKFHRPSGLMLN